MGCEIAVTPRAAEQDSSFREIVSFPSKILICYMDAAQGASAMVGGLFL